MMSRHDCHAMGKVSEFTCVYHTIIHYSRLDYNQRVSEVSEAKFTWLDYNTLF